MSDTRKQKSFLLYLDNYDLIEDLAVEEKGEWIEAVFLYKRGETIPDFPKGTLINTAFKVVRNQLDRDAEGWEEICRKRASAGRKGGLAKSNNAKQCLSNLADNENDRDNEIDSETDNDKVNENEKETETKQEDTVYASVGRQAGASLFTLDELKDICDKEKVNLTEKGITSFYSEMLANGWILYHKPVEKENILRVLRAFAKYHPEYGVTNITVPMVIVENDETQKELVDQPGRILESPEIIDGESLPAGIAILSDGSRNYNNVGRTRAEWMTIEEIEKEVEKDGW